jgi:hypothetical protein
MADIKFLDKYQSELLLENIKTLKWKVIIMIMLDCGLRVSETINLKYKNFDFKKELILVESLKKREKKLIRKVPISKRLYKLLAEYLSKKNNINGEDYLFPSQYYPGKPIQRYAVNKFLENLNKSKLHFDFLNPHCLRHSFGTNHISNGTPLENIKTMLGHTKYDTTLIYADIPTEILRRNINKVNDKKDSFLTVVWKKLGVIKEDNKKISINFHKDNFSIGRISEFETLANNAKKGINTILLGPIGVGKSHLLDNIKTDRKILKIDDLSGIKQTLGQLLLYLYDNDKEHCKQLIYGDLDMSSVKVKINKLSIKNISDEIKKIVDQKEYILSIDSVDGITPKGIQLIEELKDHFIIFACARMIKIDRSSFVWNFDRIDVKPLERAKAIELIAKLSYDIQVEDQILFRNHIFEQSNGNPRVIFEIIDRYRREPVITNEVVKQIRHTASLKEIDMTFVLFIGFGCLYVLRYMSREVDNDGLRFIGGIALVLMLLSRQLLSFTKKKFI